MCPNQQGTHHLSYPPLTLAGKCSSKLPFTLIPIKVLVSKDLSFPDRHANNQFMGTHACTHLLPNAQIPSPLSGNPMVSSSQIPEHRHKCVVNYAKLPLDTKAMPGTCIHTQAAPGLDLSAYFPDIYPARKRHAHYPTTIRHGAGHGALTCCPCNRGVAPSSPHSSRKPQSSAGVHCALRASTRMCRCSPPSCWPHPRPTSAPRGAGQAWPGKKALIGKIAREPGWGVGGGQELKCPC